MMAPQSCFMEYIAGKNACFSLPSIPHLPIFSKWGQRVAALITKTMKLEVCALLKNQPLCCTNYKLIM